MRFTFQTIVFNHPLTFLQPYSESKFEVNSKKVELEWCKKICLRYYQYLAFLHWKPDFRSEVCRSRSTGVDSGKSWCFSTGTGAGPGVDIFNWNRTRSRSDFSS